MYAIIKTGGKQYKVKNDDIFDVEKLEGEKFLIQRSEKFGGNAEYGNYEELEKAFVNKEVHPMDLKSATAKYIDKFLQPVRDHFEKNSEAKKLLEKVKSYIVTK